MIERSVLALSILLIVVGIGHLVRAWNLRRCASLADRMTLNDLATDLPQIITFYGQHCGACDKQKQINDDLHDDRPGSVSIRYIDAAAESSLAIEYGVIVVPTTIVVAPTGRVIAMVSGVLPRDRLTTYLAQAA